MWDVVYKRAIDKDGNLLFPKKLTSEFLENAKKSMGSYLYSNQYLNEVIPDDAKVFKKEWIKYYSFIPENTYTFAMIDPAISQQDSADYTATVVIKVDEKKNWYVIYAQRERLTPTQIVNKCFGIQKTFNCIGIGIESIAYQKALIYMLKDIMSKTGVYLPIKEVIPPNNKTKEIKILGLVPRFEFGSIYLNQGLVDLELEYAQFPRASHDDLMDSLASIEQLIFYPVKEDKNNANPSITSPNYENWYIQQLGKGETIQHGGYD